MVSTTPQSGEERRPFPGQARRVLTQTLRLTRTELVLFYRYRMALYIAALPLMFGAIGLLREGDDVVPGVDMAATYIAGSIPLGAMIIGVMHVANVLTARREQMVLKRFRVSGVPPAALFGAVVLSILVVVAVLAVAFGGFVTVRYDLLPTAPLLLVVTLLLITTIMVLVGAATTRLARNAEMAQMVAIVPFMLFYAASGLMVPFEALPDTAATVCRALPMAPAVELVQSAYAGYDFTGGVQNASEASAGELWLASPVPLLTLVVWCGAAVLALRFFQWDPRRAG